MNNIKLIAGRSNLELAQKISDKLKIKLEDIVLDNFANSELNVEIKEKVRGDDVYIIQTACKTEHFTVDNFLFELCSIADACKRSHAAKIIAIVPCFPYARSDKKDKPRVPINAKLVANIMSASGINQVITIDIHSGQIQGFFDNSFHHLFSTNPQTNYLKQNIFKNMSNEEINKNFVLVAPDSGAVRKVDACAKKLQMKCLIMNKRRDYSCNNTVLSSTLSGTEEDIKDKTVILIDDIIDTAGTMVSASNELLNFGAKSIIIMATHGIFSGQAFERINTCDAIEQVIVTNSIPQQNNMNKSNKIVCIDISDLFAEAIKRIQEGSSIGEMFN